MPSSVRSVEFSYKDYETKSGDIKTTDSTWIQNYRLNMASFIWDPRFLVFNAGTSYSIYSNKNSSDSKALNYTLGLSFFPGRKISWELHGSKDINTIETSNALPVTTSRQQTTAALSTFFLITEDRAVITTITTITTTIATAPGILLSCRTSRSPKITWRRRLWTTQADSSMKRETTLRECCITGSTPRRISVLMPE